MSEFPLYTSLSSQVPKKDLSVLQKKEFMDKVQAVDDHGKERIFALIYFYNNEYGPSSNDDLPYGGTSALSADHKGCQHLTWTLTQFPIKLRHILYRFVCMHTDAMAEDSRIEAQRTLQ